MTDTIHAAAERGDLEAVRRFVEVEGASVDCEDEGGDTPLIVAVRSIVQNNAPIIRYLISKDASVEEPRKNGQTALMVASHNGNVDAAKILLEEGHANVNARSFHYDTALTYATRSLNVDIARLLLEEGHANVNFQSSKYATALTYATLCPEGFCVVSTLLQYGAGVLRTRGNRPLLNACEHPGSVEVVRQLLEHGSNATDIRAIHYAAQYSDGATIRLLIAHGADVNASVNHNCYFKTPLVTATYFSNAATVKALLEHSANVHITFEYHEKGLLHIVRNAEICSILLDHCRTTLLEFRSFLLKADSSQNIALHIAASVEIARLLVEQPRCHDMQLSPTCHAQLVRVNCNGITRKHGSYHSKVREYLETFESLALSVPTSGDTNRCSDNEIAVKLNPALNVFQQSVAEEVLSLLMTTTDCLDSIAHGILGYLSLLDVMKRE